MNTHNEFIGVYRNVYPDGYCQHLISEFERLVEAGAGSDRKKSENASHHKKSDMQLAGNNHHLNMFDNVPAQKMFFGGLQNCYEQYVATFSMLGNDRLFTTDMKMQRTDPGEGYHVWHAEQGPREFSQRVLVFILYLNTLEPEDGGETEFLYQRLRIRPEENTMVIWPAAFTHTHRGNTVLGDKSKYIVTGWFHYE